MLWSLHHQTGRQELDFLLLLLGPHYSCWFICSMQSHVPWWPTLSQLSDAIVVIGFLCHHIFQSFCLAQHCYRCGSWNNIEVVSMTLWALEYVIPSLVGRIHNIDSSGSQVSAGQSETERVNTTTQLSRAWLYCTRCAWKTCWWGGGGVVVSSCSWRGQIIKCFSSPLQS